MYEVSFLREFALRSIVICFAIFGMVCISFVIVGIETTTESRQQTVEPPGRTGYVRCWESRRLRALEMFGHVLFVHYVGIAAVKSVGNVWSCIVCLLRLGITAARRIMKEWSCIDGTFSAGREC
ncbi:hypothetical protein FPQ18DRAFT_340286 [Pyronema domesticum]|nr:hypothetical protein FPQ18DRAFT_340286 [Pyronema domesticum]